MKKNIYLHLVVISLFLIAVCIALVIIGNQGARMIENALNNGYTFESISDQYNKVLLGKALSGILLIGLFYMGWSVAKTFYLRQQIRFILLPFIGISLVFGSISTVIQEFLNPLFAVSYLQDFVLKFQVDTSIPTLIFYSVVGLMCLWSSIAIIENAKSMKGISISNLGSKFNTLCFVLNSFVFLTIIFILSNPQGLVTIVLLLYAITFGLIGLVTGDLTLISFMKNGKLSSSSLVESIFQSTLSAFGIMFFVYTLIITATGFDSTVISSVEAIIQFHTPFVIFYLVSGTIALAVWHFNLLGVQSSSILENTKSQLSLLKSQINPHFLFNSLNSIYGIALAEKSPKTADGVQKLSEMMRFMLKENTQEKISLNKEIEYIHNYIDLQSLRLDTNKHVQLNVSIEQPCDGQISPMLLIPMIENAFKHGVSIDKPSFIDISLACNENEVSLKVKNSNHHKEKTAAEESGIGLENVRKRLALLYPEKHLFQVYENEETYEAFIKIELV